MNDTISSKVTLILPVRRAGSQVIRCLRSIHAGTVVPEIFLMDCTAAPGALEQSGEGACCQYGDPPDANAVCDDVFTGACGGKALH